MNGAIIAGIITIAILFAIGLFNLACIWYEVLEGSNDET